MNGSDVKFENLYETYQPKIRRYLTRLVGAVEAEDLTQEVFVKVSQALNTFRGESQFSTWIYRIATNTALDRIRSPVFQRLASTRAASDLVELESLDKAGGRRPEKNTPVDQELVRKEMNECIRSFVENLPEDYRTVLVLSEIEGLKNQEIAEVLGVSLHTVKIRLHRARARLRKELEAHCNFYGTEQGELACDLKAAFEQS